MPREEQVCEIITVGNELLTGRTLNTNSQWLAERITQLGGFVRRCVVVRDDVIEIAEILKEALTRNPNFIIFAGGLGPTYDDLTLDGVAKGFKRRLVVNKRALQMLRTKYRQMWKKGVIEKYELTEARIKMARLPSGAIPLLNPVGTAPGVLLNLDSCILACLPGVPSEMKGIFEESLKQVIAERTGRVFSYSRTLNVEGIVESSIAPLLEKIVGRFPDVYIKSHPQGIEGGISRIRIEFTGRSRTKARVKVRVSKAAQELAKVIRKRGGSVELV